MQSEELIEFPAIDRMLASPKYPLYDINKSYADNLRDGPCFNQEAFQSFPKRERLPEDAWIDFLGYRIASPLGVPAGPLLNSSWIALAAKLGFDVVAYKTIRCHAYAGHPLPNVIFVERDPNDPKIARQRPQPGSVEKISITNSFGIPSMPPEYLQQDIAKARSLLHAGQLLVVSVFGTAGEDFVHAALLAKEAGAHVIEANFSCPNLASKEKTASCSSSHNFFNIASLIVKAVSPIPVLIKMECYENSDSFRDVLIGLAKAGVRGVCGINSVSMKIVDAHQRPALGVGRETGGVCGELIRPAAQNFVATADKIIRTERLDLELVGGGGIMLPHHFDEFLQAGAKVVTTATGMMWDPYLAIKWHNKRGK